MKVADLEGQLLDYWVARAEGLTIEHANIGEGWMVVIPGRGAKVIGLDPTQGLAYAPSVRWDQGGEIIEREHIELLYFGNHGDPFPWEAQVGEGTHYIDQYAGDAVGGPTPLVAAMRTRVRSKFGDDVPEQE